MGAGQSGVIGPFVIVSAERAFDSGIENVMTQCENLAGYLVSSVFQTN